MTVLLDAWQDWECPNCHLTDRTRPLPAGASQFHNCPRLHGLVAPLVRAGTDCGVTAEERGDYLGADVQATGDDGKAYMAVRVTRPDGEDLFVNAGLARAEIRF